MVLPTGTISFSDINTECLYPVNQTLSINDARVRLTAGVASGAISMGDLRGKSYFSVSGGTGSVFGTGSRLGRGNVSATTNAAFVGTITGGQSPMSYVWELVSGDAASASTPSSSTTTFRRTVWVEVGMSETSVGIYRCKITDAGGAVIYGPYVTVTTNHNESS